MKNLFLMRHAHAAYHAISDFDRDLTAAGIAEAESVGRQLEQIGFLPDTVLCSSALRARQTAERVCDVFGFPLNNIVADSVLYHIDGDELAAYVRALPQSSRQILLVAHNPAVSVCACDFGGPAAVLRPGEGLLLELDPEFELWRAVRGVAP